MANTYVLQRRAGDFSKLPLYYCGNWDDTLHIEKAARYTLDEAMAQAKALREFGDHYRAVRIENGKAVC